MGVGKHIDGREATYVAIENDKRRPVRLDPPPSDLNAFASGSVVPPCRMIVLEQSRRALENRQLGMTGSLLQQQTWRVIDRLCAALLVLCQRSSARPCLGSSSHRFALTHLSISTRQLSTQR